MRLRPLLHAAVCLLTPLLILACSVVFTGGDVRRWALAHRDIPLLWLIDFCALYMFVLLTFAITSRETTRKRELELTTLRQEHLNQLEAVVAQAAELDRENTELEDKISTLEHTSAEGQQAFEAEARTLAEQVFRAIQGQIEAQGRQLEAVNLALQHHRAEIAQLRHGLKIAQQRLDGPISESVAINDYDTMFNPEPQALDAAPDTFAITAAPQEAYDVSVPEERRIATLPPQAVAESAQ